jgi:hypothetical protein
MRNAEAKIQGQSRHAALPAVRMNELDKLELDEESQVRLSSVAVMTQTVSPCLQIAQMR